MKKKAKVDPFLKKYARIALGAGVAAGAIMPAQAQNPPAAADQAPAAVKASGDAKVPAAKREIAVSVVYGPPAAEFDLSKAKPGKVTGIPPGIIGPKRTKASDAAGSKQEGAAPAASAPSAPAADATKKP